MLLAPLMYYGNAMEHDMDYRQFVIMFQSIYLEGFARPRRGVREILDTLLNRLDESGGELKLESGVRKILVENEKISGVELMDGTRIECDSALSSIGLLETIAICPESAQRESKPAEGRLAFMESINILDSSPVELGMEHAITFFSNRENFSFRKPDEPIDVNDGVICVPDNFSYGEPLNSNMVRITNKADYTYWENINPMENLPRKREWHSRSIEGAADYMPDIRQKIKFLDIFTPRTVKRYTGHINGAVYGSPDKVWSGGTGGTALPNLFLCGTDQGFLGIIGAMLSGISIANQYLLK
jgi:phytoene dehydrogenase-like protein